MRTHGHSVIVDGEALQRPSVAGYTLDIRQREDSLDDLRPVAKLQHISRK